MLNVKWTQMDSGIASGGSMKMHDRKTRRQQKIKWRWKEEKKPIPQE